MAFFKKKGDVGVVDLADLQRRGIFKPRMIPKKTTITTDNQGYADLSQQQSTTTQPTQQSSSGGGGFLDWFGGGSSSNTSASAPVTASSSEYGSTTPNDYPMLKNKIEDIEFKIENIGRKLNGFLERLELIEKKVNRLEGR